VTYKYCYAGADGDAYDDDDSFFSFNYDLVISS